MTLADHVRILGRGPGRSRSLNQQEATEAMALMLGGDADPAAIGALLMLLRMKGETAEEIAGFAQAAQAAMPPIEGVDLDWPSYAAGRTRGLPWFLLSAQLVARSGRGVLIHGWNGTDPKVRAGLATAGIACARTPDEAAHLIARSGIAYLPLETAHPVVFDLLSLRDVLGLRSCINTVCRMLNPARASASVQGVFHPSYRLLQAHAAELLGWQNLTVIKGGGGEFERTPVKSVEAFGLRDGILWQNTLAPLLTDPDLPRPAEDRDLAALWAGADAPFEEQVILGTAALALSTLGEADPLRVARQLWTRRSAKRAA
ncbi:MAG: glycosyl transferase family 3 [Alphaproteobacteria bacterium MedPE-SWcel]|mgnify:FL=1|nr:MAG: glycosyl transferase family 3 [Alphaproteobacteria bacterium MedPE-SWcel]